MKLKSKLIQIFFVIFSLVFSIVFIGTIFDNKSLVATLNPLVIIIGLIVFFIILYLIFKFIEQKVPETLSLKKEIIIFGVAFLFILSLQIIFSYYLKSYPGWDWNDCYRSALAYVNGFPESVDWEYFQKFPNNNGILYFEIIFFKFLKSINLLDFSLEATIILNIILIDISAILTYLTVRNFFGKKKAIFSLVLILLSAGFFNYIPILYTDTLTMLYPIGILYLYSIWKKSQNDKVKYIIFPLMAITCVIGMKLKFTCVIILIAILIDIFINYNFKKYFKPILILSFSFIISFSLVKGLETKYSIFPYDINNNEKRIPYTHWIMMGLYERTSSMGDKKFIGWYDPTAYELTLSYDTIEERQKANINKIKEKLHDFGALGYADFLYRKMLFTWSDGTYYGPMFLSEQPVKQEKTFLSNLYHIDGDYINSSFLENTVFILYIYLMLILGSIAFIIKKENIDFSSYISLFGVLIFFLIWEASSRYLINYVPIMIVASFYGITKTYQYINNIMGVTNEKK